MLRKVVHFVFIYSVGLFWTSLVFLRYVWLLIRKPRKVLLVKDRQNPPECLNDSSLGVHGYIRLQNVKIHYVGNGDEGKPLMLLLHGFPEFWYSWRHQLREFSNSYRVVAIDTRGYGQSDKPSKVSDYTVTKLVEDIHEIIPALGYQSCVLVGHDWGGIIAWMTTIKYPDLCDRLIIMNCPHPFVFGRYMQTHWKQFIKSWYMFFFNMPYFPEMMMRSGDFKMFDNMFCGKTMGCQPGRITQQDLEAFKYEFRESGSLTPPINYIRASIRTPPKETTANLELTSRSSKGHIDKPVLLLWGTKDGALETEMAKLSAKFCSHFTLTFIDGASHWVQQDEPAKVNEYMWQFLKAE